MDEKLLIVWHWMEPRLKIIMMVVFAVLLGLVYYVKSSEQPGGMALGPGAQKPDPFKGSRESVKVVQNALYVPPAPIEKTSVSILLTNSMFNLKTVLGESEKVQMVQNLFREAQSLDRQGKTRLALEKCEEVLALHPQHLGANSLKNKLSAQMETEKAPAEEP